MTEARRSNGPRTVPETRSEEPESVDVDALQADRDQLFDRLQRLAAEFDNFRKRNAREQAAFAERANERLVKELIPILDDLGARSRLRRITKRRSSRTVSGLCIARLPTCSQKQGLAEIETDGQVRSARARGAALAAVRRRRRAR